MPPVESVRRLVAAINARNVPAILASLTPDHRFVDSLGAVISGRAALEQAWQGYFRLVPDYAIQIEEELVLGDVVVLFGAAGGTYAANGPPRSGARWGSPAAWRAVVRDDRVAEWRVYADNEPLRRLMRRGSGPGGSA
ncbi:MAG: nuclear transport factor 2 family protein [Gemmatimonadales bacterium]